MASLAGVTASGLTEYQQLKIAATSTAGTLIHTAGSGTSNFDVLTIEAVNSSATTEALTIEWGGVASPDDLIVVNIPPTGSRPTLVIDGRRINNAKVVRAFSSTTNVVLVYAHVVRNTA